MGLSDIAAADELSLIQRAAGGDHNAFAVLMRRYEPRIHSYLRQMVGDAEQASDLTQETFLAAYRALGRWQPPSEPRQGIPISSRPGSIASPPIARSPCCVARRLCAGYSRRR